jgi:hypothetical protein
MLCRVHLSFLGVAIFTAAAIDASGWLRDARNEATIRSKNNALAANESLGIFFFGFSPTSSVWRKSLLLLPSAYPFWLYQSVMNSVRAKGYVQLSLMALRWMGFFILFRDHLAMMWIPQTIACALLGFVESLHREPVVNSEASRIFANCSIRNVFNGTQNVSEKGPIWTWVSGGQNYQIEHRLFPDMPSRNYPKISRDVKIFAQHHGLPYRERRAADIVEAISERH